MLSSVEQPCLGGLCHICCCVSLFWASVANYSPKWDSTAGPSGRHTVFPVTLVTQQLIFYKALPTICQVWGIPQ